MQAHKHKQTCPMSVNMFVVVTVVVVVLCAGPTKTSAYDYDNYGPTVLDDPLQPVWDRMDEMPNLVTAAVQTALLTQFTTINRKLDTRLQAVEVKMNQVKDDIMREIGGDSPYPQSLMTLMSHILLNDMTESTTKIEGHIDRQLAALETRLKAYIDSKLSPPAVPEGDARAGSEVSLAETLTSYGSTLQNISVHVLKINEKLGGSEGEDSCGTLVDKVSELMAAVPLGGGGGPTNCNNVNQQAVPAINQITSFLPRDCSDKHWQLPESPSGVYETFPTMDPKAPVNAYCDMGMPGDKETGGWTVILRRRNSTYGLVNFNRTWSEYRAGFGDPGEGEWWFGLGPLHALTYRQPYEVNILLHDIQLGTYHASYNSFRVEDEGKNFTLNINGFMGNLSHDALIPKHHGSPFSTWDRDNDEWESGSCAQRNGGGWWFNACHYTTLTAPFPTSTDRTAATIRWLENDWLVLDDVIIKIRPVNYADRFNSHYVS